jgi:hypothetical protein
MTGQPRPACNGQPDTSRMPIEFYQGRPLKPEELETIRHQIEQFDTIDPEMRGIVKRNWPHLISKLPPEDDVGDTRRRLMVNRVTWKQVGLVREPGRYMLRFGWVTVTADDLQVWSLFPDATFALYEVGGAESKDEYRLGSVDLHTPSSDAPP